MDNIKILFGKKLRELRRKRDLTQSRLAELVNVDNKHISCIESGKSFPSPELLGRLAISLRIEPKDFFEFYYLSPDENLKAQIIAMVNNLDNEELKLAHKYIRTFLI